MQKYNRWNLPRGRNEEMKKFYLSGLSLRQTGDIYEISAVAVFKTLVRMGVPRRIRNSWSVLPKRKEQRLMKRVYKKTGSVTKTAQIFKMPVYKALNLAREQEWRK